MSPKSDSRGKRERIKTIFADQGYTDTLIATVKETYNGLEKIDS